LISPRRRLSPSWLAEEPLTFFLIIAFPFHIPVNPDQRFNHVIHVRPPPFSLHPLHREVRSLPIKDSVTHFDGVPLWVPNIFSLSRAPIGYVPSRLRFRIVFSPRCSCSCISSLPFSKGRLLPFFPGILYDGPSSLCVKDSLHQYLGGET